jgi:hypothetical protein
VKHGNSRAAAQRRKQLVVLCAAQRDELAALMVRLEGPLKVADRGVSIIRYLRDRPLAVGAVAAVLTVSRVHGAWKWAQRGFVAWRAYRAFCK